MPTPAFKTLNVLDGGGSTRQARVYDLAGDGSTGYLPSTAVEDGLNVTQGAIADAAASNSTSSWSVVALLKGLYALLAAVLKVGGTGVSVSGTFTRPSDTNPYAANDVVSNSTSTTTLVTIAGLARVSGGSGYITGCRLNTDKKSITPRIRVHLFSASSPTVSADNAPHQATYGDYTKRLGSFDLPAMTTPADTTNSTVSGAADLNLRIPFVAVGGTAIWAMLETLDAFTPASGQNFAITLTADLD